MPKSPMPFLVGPTQPGSAQLSLQSYPCLKAEEVARILSRRLMYQTRPYLVKVDPKSGVLSGLLLMGFRPLGQVHGVYHQKRVDRAARLVKKEMVPKREARRRY
ncbi:hypothetical protein KY290_001267 [Solanum tuberosum]|uniref:Uncharacterized protein n=1 Tax=Solanum tuberosum TaxID=4113 RepID=A0ABQ7WLU3_SOLTU|nr:hypothetical protein KY285_001181 [Solanum tuberosum]KAH0781669.1 hypothetical protein KY290_001267 [Solanum tuberosum]